MKNRKNWLERLRRYIARPVSQEKALRLAAQALGRRIDPETLACHGTKPGGCHIYVATSEPCWYIFAPWDDQNGPLVLRSRRVILVGKLTGAIHYDGSANDEG